MLRAPSILIPVFAIALPCLLCGVSEPCAAAAPSADLVKARKLFAEAAQDEAGGRWAEALRKLETVAGIKETAGVRFHIATCREHLGQLVEAIADYERARELAVAQKADDVSATVDERIVDVQKRIPRITIEAPRGGKVSVTLDGEPVALDALSGIPVNPGTHQVVITVDGKDRLDRYVKLDERGQETVRLPATPAAMRPAPAAPRSQHVEQAGTSVPPLAWVSLGAGAVLGVSGYLAYHQADNVASDSADVCARSVRCDPTRVDVVRRWDATALGLWVGAAAALGTGVTIIVLHSGSSDRDVAVVGTPTSIALRGSIP